MKFHLLILAAGEGTRMRSKLVKVMHPVLGKPMLTYVLETAARLEPLSATIVTGKDGKIVNDLVGNFNFKTVTQTERLGTGHAVLTAKDLYAGVEEPLVVVYGDNPFLQSETVAKLVEAYYTSEAFASVLTVEATDPHGYGRILKDKTGNILEIKEEKDCNEEQRKITEVNSGCYCFNSKQLFKALDRVKPNNKQNEIYLTDVIGIMVSNGQKVVPIKILEEWQTLGVDSRQKLALANMILRDRINEHWMTEGVSIVDPRNTWIGSDVIIGADTTILPGTHIQGTSIIGGDCLIGPDTIIADSKIGKGCNAQFAVIKDSEVFDNVNLGPFCYLRGGAFISDGAKVGTFVEIKNSLVGPKSKVPHLSYMGDAVIGKNVNIGAGSITCNYDGTKKSKTTIGDNAFIGSDTLFIAPVEVGKDAMTGAGSVVRQNVAQNEVVAGVPAKKIKGK